MAAFSIQPQRHMAASTDPRAAGWPATQATPAIRYRCNLTNTTEAAATTIAIHGVKPFHGGSGTRRLTEGTT